MSMQPTQSLADGHNKERLEIKSVSWFAVFTEAFFSLTSNV